MHMPWHMHIKLRDLWIRHGHDVAELEGWRWLFGILLFGICGSFVLR